MDDLQPLVDDPESSPLGRALLASARDDMPSSAARARAARRLGIAAILTVGASAGSEAGALAVAGKLTTVLLALGGVVGLAMWQSTAAPPAPHVAPAALTTSRPVVAISATPAPAPASVQTPAPATATTAAIDAPSPAAAPGVTRPVAPTATPPGAAPARLRTVRPRAAPPAPAPEAAPVEVAEPAPAPAIAAPAEPAPPAPAPAVAREVTAPPATDIPAGPSRLSAEVALLDRARRSLGARDVSAALAALAEYHQRFANGDLDAEADMVMIEILIAQGEIGRARALGAEFFTRFPRSPLVQRVHSLLDRLPP